MINKPANDQDEGRNFAVDDQDEFDRAVSEDSDEYGVPETIVVDEDDEMPITQTVEDSQLLVKPQKTSSSGSKAHNSNSNSDPKRKHPPVSLPLLRMRNNESP